MNNLERRLDGNEELAPEFQSKFVQINSVGRHITALDEDGNVWRFAWTNDCDFSPKGCWHLINRKRYVPTNPE